MNLFLVRHPRPAIETGVCYGSTDIALPENWEHDTDGIKERLQRTGGLQATRVYSSPLQRCARPAVYLFGETRVVFDDRLRELDFGRWEMQPWSSVPREQLDEWAADLYGFRPPDGESGRALQARCAAFVDDHLQPTQSDCCIITHGGVIRCLLTLLVQHAQQHGTDWLNESVAWGGVYHLQWDSSVGTFQLVNIDTNQQVTDF